MTTDTAPPDPTRLTRSLRLAAWIGGGVLWLIPLVAEQVSAEMAWTAFDFIVWGVMLTVAAGVFDLATRMKGGLAYQMAAAIAVGSTFLLVWVQGAVGVVGNENDLFNLIFFLPLLFGVAGGFITGFSPDGLSRTLWTMTVLQAAALGVSLAVTRDPDSLLVAFWLVAWVMSGWLFQRASLEARHA